MSASNRAIWKISPGRGAWQWNDWKKYGVMAIGWDYEREITNSLSDYKTVTSLREALEKAEDPQPGHAAWKLWYFSRDVKREDIVIAYGYKSILDIGIVKSKYYPGFDKLWEDGRLYLHRRRVHWLHVGPIELKDPKILNFLSQNNTIYLVDHQPTLDFINSILQGNLEYSVSNRIREKVETELGSGVEVDVEINKTVNKEIKNALKTMKNPKFKKIELEKEFIKLKFEKPPKRIKSRGRVRAWSSVDINAPTNLVRAKIEDEFVYLPPLMKEADAHKYLKTIRKFRALMKKILNAMTTPDIAKKIIRIAIDEPYRDAYKVLGGTVYNVRNYEKNKTEFYWIFTAAREVAYLLNPVRNAKHMNLMRALMIRNFENMK